MLVKWSVPANAGSVLPNWSWAVTVKPKLVPATGVVLLASTNRLAGAALIAMVTVVESALALSAAVIVCVPALMSVAENVP